MGDDKESGPKGGRAKAVGEAMGVVGRSVGVGFGSGSIVAIALAVVDPTGAPTQLSALVGIVLGGLNGFLEILVKHLRSFLMGRAEARKAMLEAESDANYQAMLAAERARAEAERRLAVCESEKAEMRARLDRLETQHRETEEKISTLEASHATKDALQETKFEALMARFLRLVDRMNKMDGGSA